MATTLVMHRFLKYVGVTIGTTRMKHLFENPMDEEETCVRLPNGTFKIASTVNLVGLDGTWGDGGPNDPSVGIQREHAATIIEQINNWSVPEEWLVEKQLWTEVCRIRGKNYQRVDPAAWQEVCRTRGYLLYRRNARGF